MTELERCDHEICEIEQLLGNGHPDVQGLLLGLGDWRTERRLVIEGSESNYGAAGNDSRNRPG